MRLTPGVVHNFLKPWVYRISTPFEPKDHRFLFEKSMGHSQECVSLFFSTIDGSMPTQVDVENQLSESNIQHLVRYVKKKCIPITRLYGFI